MTFIHPDRHMIPQLGRLWCLCFGEDNRFADLFFNHRFAPSQALVAMDGSQLTAMLFMLPVAVRGHGCTYDGRYIYAVATDPMYRSKGISTKLLSAAHAILESEGADLSFLVPASPSLFDFYRQRGFKDEFYLTHTRAHVTPAPLIPLEPKTLAELYPLRKSYFEDSSLFVDWDVPALHYCDMDNYLNGGETLYFTLPTPGYAVCVPTEASIIIKEITVSPTDDLLASIAERYHKEVITLRSRATTDPQPHGMCYRYKTYPENYENLSGASPYLSLVLD